MKMIIYGQNDFADTEHWLITKFIQQDITDEEIEEFLDHQTGFRNAFDSILVKITDDDELTVFRTVCF